AEADALSRQADEEVEQDRAVRELEARDVEVMLGEADRVVGERIGELRLLGELSEHALVEVAAEAGAAALDVGAAAGGGQVEERDLHALGRPTSRRAMTMRWIWPVPSTMSIALTSR